MPGKNIRHVLPSNESPSQNVSYISSPINDGQSHQQHPSEYDFTPMDGDRCVPEMVTESYFMDISFEREGDSPLATETCPSCGRCPCLTSSNIFQDLLATKLPRSFDKGKEIGYKDFWWHPVLYEVLDQYYESIQVIVERKAIFDLNGQTWVEKEVFLP